MPDTLLKFGGDCKSSFRDLGPTKILIATSIQIYRSACIELKKSVILKRRQHCKYNHFSCAVIVQCKKCKVRKT